MKFIGVLWRRYFIDAILNTRSQYRWNAKHREWHQHQPEVPIGAYQFVDIGRRLAAIWAVEIVEFVERHLAIRIGGNDDILELLDPGDKICRNTVVGDDGAVIGHDRKFAVVGMRHQHTSPHGEHGGDQT